ncbi:MAG: lysophospholipid acyltransferase family protein [Anaerolineae bacterium]|nr:lysophospholipid acyltransferase family protein [Phycisphaerae bacterium]
MTQTQTEPAVLSAEAVMATRRIDGAAGWWLSALFFLAEIAPWFLRLLRPIAVRATVLSSRTIGPSVRDNARRIFGRELASSELKRFTRAVVANFYDFVIDVGRSGKVSAQDLRDRIESVDGIEAFHAARAQQRGAVLVTAHMGAFEVGLAALRQWVPKVNVVFKRDSFGGFERFRWSVRAMLGVIEDPIDDGFSSLVRLRDSLNANEVVVMQGDRAMPGQRSQVVPFLHGHLRLPLGPVKLAQLTGSPIIPVFLVRGRSGGFCVHLADAIDVDPAAAPVDGIDPALRALARTIESLVHRFPEQWLVINRAFVEDAERVD